MKNKTNYAELYVRSIGKITKRSKEHKGVFLTFLEKISVRSMCFDQKITILNMDI